MKETDLTRQILDYLAHRNVVAYATHDAKHRPATVGALHFMEQTHGLRISHGAIYTISNELNKLGFKL
jgi:hypothetical protein